MLIDLDLAKEVGQGSSGARHRTGTMEFMAIEVLQGLSHTDRHDLESFSGNPKGQPKDSMLPRWYTGTYKKIAQNKRGDMSKGGFEQISEEFPPEFDAVKPLCRKLRGVLFPIREGDLFTDTPQNPEILYDPAIEAFDALKTIRKERAGSNVA